MTLIILGEAEQEFAESIAYYESKEPGLGWRFRNEVAEAVGRILRHPRGAVKAERIPPSKSARFSALHRLRHSRRHDLDRGDCAWLSSPRVLDWSRVKVKGCIGEGGFATLIR